jgi:DNA (cytosine-5)-methyltransferase 1
MRHASFFSGVGGLDLGFERAGIHTVSVSEIDPYANSVLAERFPDAPNLGDIVKLAEKELVNKDDGRNLADKNDRGLSRSNTSDREGRTSDVGGKPNVGSANGGGADWRTADIWSGGFPCQDLSVAGKRAGFAGKRSSLAFTFLDLVEQHRPRWLVLENVPGLFSSNKGADFGRLLYEMEQLGYGVSWRTLDARYFGVAQRRRRVFLVGSLESDRAGEVLLECEGCERHPSPRWTQRQGVASGSPDGSGIARTVRASLAKRGERGDGSDDLIVSQAPDSDRVRAADGLDRRLDNQQGVARKSSFGHYEITEDAGTLKSSGGDIGGGSENLILSFPSRFGSNANVTESQAQSMAHSAGAPAVLLDSVGGTTDEDDLLPVGLDSHRYRCCGNGVVAPVAEWIGRRIVEADRRWREGEGE